MHHGADEKICWVLERDLLFSFGFKREVFQVLKVAYPAASALIRQTLLDTVLAGLEQEDAEESTPNAARTRAYERFNLLVWLQTAAPRDELLERALADVRAKHPDFEKREHPDFDMWTSGVYDVSPQSPIALDELLDADLADLLGWLLEFKGGQLPDEPSREGLLEVVAAAVGESFEWSQRLVAALRARGSWSSDLWSAMLRGWRGYDLSAEEWGSILTLLEATPELDTHAQELAWLSEDGVKGKAGASLRFVARIESLTERLYDGVDDVDIPTGATPGDLFQLSLNHIAGRALQIWLRCLGRRRAAAGDKWTALPANHLAFYTKVICDDTGKGCLGIPILSRQLHFLFSCDPRWTSQFLMGAFDWDSDETKAALAWQGYLTSRPRNDALLTHLLPLYRKTMSRVDSLGEVKDRFAMHVADIAVFGLADPMEKGWLQEFIARAGLESRIAWVRRISFLLRSLDGDAKADLWERWLGAYWRGRQDGIPRPLDEDETREMVTKWAARLEPVFPDVVDTVCESSCVWPGSHTMFWSELVDSDLASRHANSVSRLLIHILPGCGQPFYHCDELEVLVETAGHAGARPTDVRRICDEIVRLGCRGTEDLLRKLYSDAGDADDAG